MKRFKDVALLAAEITNKNPNFIFSFWFDEFGLMIVCTYKTNIGAEMMPWTQIERLPPRAVNDTMLALMERVRRPPGGLNGQG